MKPQTGRWVTIPVDTLLRVKDSMDAVITNMGAQQTTLSDLAESTLCYAERLKNIERLCIDRIGELEARIKELEARK